MTPRRIQAWLFFARHKRLREQYELLALHALAASGDIKTIQRQLNEWEDDF